MIVSSGEHFEANSPGVQAEAVLFIDVELIHLSDHRFKGAAAGEASRLYFGL